MLLRISVLCLISSLLCNGEKEDEKKTHWVDDDGLEVKIVKPITAEKCKVKSQPGDTVDQYYRLTDKAGTEIGSNFGGKPYTFKLGANAVIAGMDRAMTGMCIGEKRKVVIPGKLGFGDAGRERDNIESDQTLYYTVQLVDIFRPVPGPKWKEDDGLEIEVTHKIDEDKCKKSKPGDTIHQHYVLHLNGFDGKFVDSSHQHGDPFIFQLGKKKVIDGMDRAMTNMCEGEHRKVVIPAALGYGKEGSPPEIPGGATLFFEIELQKLIAHDEL